MGPGSAPRSTSGSSSGRRPPSCPSPVRSVLFDHIAIAVPRLADAEAILAGQLGGRSAYGMTRGAFSFWHWRYEGGGDIEVLEPGCTATRSSGTKIGRAHV